MPNSKHSLQVPPQPDVLPSPALWLTECVLHEPSNICDTVCRLLREMQPVRRKPDFSRKAPSHLLGSSRSLCRAVWGAGCWYLTATAALCPALRRPWHVSQDTSAQHVTASMSWQEQRTHLPQLKSGSAAPGKSGSAVFPPLLRNPGWFQVPAAAQLQHQPCLQEHKTAGVKPPQSSSLCCRDVPPQPGAARAGGGSDGKDTWPPGKWAGATSSFHTGS